MSPSHALISSLAAPIERRRLAQPGGCDVHRSLAPRQRAVPGRWRGRRDRCADARRTTRPTSAHPGGRPGRTCAGPSRTAADRASAAARLGPRSVEPGDAVALPLRTDLAVRRRAAAARPATDDLRPLPRLLARRRTACRGAPVRRPAARPPSRLARQRRRSRRFRCGPRACSPSSRGATRAAAR